HGTGDGRHCPSSEPAATVRRSWRGQHATYCRWQPNGLTMTSINSEILAALIFMVFGAGAAVIGWGYGFGTMTALGAGALPVLAGGGLFALGLAQLARAVVGQRAGEPVARAFARSDLRPLVFVLASILAFGFLIYPFGLIP